MNVVDGAGRVLLHSPPGHDPAGSRGMTSLPSRPPTHCYIRRGIATSGVANATNRVAIPQTAWQITKEALHGYSNTNHQ